MIHPYWEWVGRVAAVFFVLILWIRLSEMKNVGSLSLPEAMLGIALAVMGGVVAMAHIVPISAGLTAIAVFGALSRLALLLSTDTHQASVPRPKPTSYTFIVDGELLSSALRSMGKTEAWVHSLLLQYGIPSIEGVALAQIDERQRVFITRKGNDGRSGLLH